MRKRIITLILGLLVIGFTQAQTVIFDPATYSGTLKPGMTVVDVEGTKYLQVIVDGWNSTIDIPEIKEVLGTHMAGTIKYSQGSKTVADALTLANIASSVQVMDTVHKVPASWDATQMVPSSTSIGGRPAVNDFTYYKSLLTATMTNVHQVQFFGQEDKNWGPTVGDTLWVSRVVTVDESVLFDPATIDASTLPAGSSIEEVDGVKYAKIKVSAWDTWVNFPEFANAANNTVKFKAKYDKGSSDYEYSAINIHVNAGADSKVISSINAPATDGFIDIEAKIAENTKFNCLQVAAQMNVDPWDAISDAYVLVGKMTVSYVTLEKATPPVTGVVNFATGITIDDQYDDAFEKSTAYKINRMALGTVAGTAAAAGAEVVEDNGDSYGIFYMVGDLKNFYLYAEIEDNDPTLIGDGTAPWNNDGLEIFMDINDGRYTGATAGKRVEGVQHQLRFNLGLEGPAYGGKGLPSLFGDASSDTTDCNFKFVPGSAGYTVEIAIPWAVFFRTSTNTNIDAVALVPTLKKGHEIALEVSLIDAEAVDTRKSILNWSNNTGTDMAYERNEFWGQVKLGDGFPVGINQKQAIESLNVYPNPTTGELNIEMANIAKVEVYNLLGAKVAQFNNVENSVNVSTLSMGMYVVKATAQNGKVAVAKFNKK